MVIAGVHQLCWVSVPVTAGVVDPADGGGRVRVEQVDEHGRGRLGGERGAVAGLGVDAEGAESFAESGRGRRPTGEHAGEGPGGGGRADADVAAAVAGERGEQPGE